MDKIQQMLVKMLKRNKFFENMSDEHILKFSDLFKLWMCSEGKAIIIEWHIPEKIYILKKWTLLAKKANWLNSIALWEVKEWEVFWEMSFFYKKPAMASIICTSSTADYWEISRGNFELFLKDNPEIKTQIADVLSEREKENKEKLWWSFKPTVVAEEDNLGDIQINL